MKNSFLQSIEENIQNFKNSIKFVIQDIKGQQHKQQKQISFNQILTEQSPDNHKNHAKQQLQSKIQINNKIQKAIRNSSIARIIYHDHEPQKLAQKCIEHSEVLKQIQNQMSIGNCDGALELKIQSPTDLQQEKMRGILVKISPSFFGGSSQRLCILTKNKFIYYQGKTQQSSIAGILNFNLLPFSTIQHMQNHKIESFQIKVEKGDKSFTFRGFNSNQTMMWYQKIKQIIQTTEGQFKNVSNLSNYHRFWRKDYTSQVQFQKIAKTGDILLFRGKKSTAIFQRKVTGQQYDHIGMILLNAFNQILVFQANGGFGVGICPWKKFIKNKWYQDQQIVVLRQLKIKRTQQFLSQISKFVEQNIGKQYKFSLKNYVMSRHSTIQHEKNSYFCSSLISKLYKTLGLLDPKISSSRYMPYDFSENSNLKLLNGKFGEARLQRQKIIIF